ncbi:MAG: hypothetical protein GX455_06930 [Phycisphaerae bacterium]|nr:hypothetical protein [Phycisphaerae bacterium]
MDTKGFCWGVVLTVLAVSVCEGESLPLPINGTKWTQTVFPDAGQSELPGEPAARMMIEPDSPYGPCLVVGPWYVGQWGLRYQFYQRLPMTTGTIRGWYKTDKILPFQAEVVVSFYAGDRRIAKTRFDLEPSPAWRRFEVAVRVPPSGTDSLSPGFGLGEKTGGKIWFADLSMDSTVAPLPTEPKPALLSRFRPFLSFPESKTFRLQKDKDVWWLISPDGQPFYSVAAVGPSLPQADPIPEGLEAVQRIRDWGFNSLAGWTNPERWAKVNDVLVAQGQLALPMFAVIESNTIKSEFDWLTDGSDPGPEGHRFPDPFDPRFESAYSAAVKKVYAVLGGKPWFVAWFADNELSHDRLYRRVWSRACSETFVQSLQVRYQNISRLNDAWKSDYISFTDLSLQKPLPSATDDTQMRDYLAFERKIVQQYIETTLRCIRVIDPDRPIFSNRFMASDIGAYARLLDLYKPYDGIGVNLYPANRGEGLSAGETAFLKMFYDLTGKPILIGEWSVPAVDSGLYDPAQPQGLDWSWNEAVIDQSRRAMQARRLSLDFYNLPFVVGAHWFTWQDIDTPERRANRGLMRIDGKPWEKLTEQFRQVHASILNR